MEMNFTRFAERVLFLFVFLFCIFYFEQYLSRGAQFSYAGLNGALMKRKKTTTSSQKTITDKKIGTTKYCERIRGVDCKYSD